jgi:general secretion pathway protein I
VKTRPGAFTLLELIVAIAILAIALFGVMQVVTQGINSSISSRDRARAVELAELKLTELRLDPALEPGVTDGDFGDEQPDWSWTSDASETEIEGLLRLRITVSWQHGGQDRSVEVETCFAPDALIDATAELGAADPMTDGTAAETGGQDPAAGAGAGLPPGAGGGAALPSP